jgi:hypothetical protein
MKLTCSRGHAFDGPPPCPVCRPGYRTFKVRAELWLYEGQAAWHFVTIPKKQSETMSERFGAMSRGWGSLPVTVTIGETRFETSIFPDKKAGAYLLPIKAAVRKKENLAVGDVLSFSLEVRA